MDLKCTISQKCISLEFSLCFGSKPFSRFVSGYINIVIVELIYSLDKRAFFLVSTSSSVGPQIYELVTATVTDRKK